LAATQRTASLGSDLYPVRSPARLLNLNRVVADQARADFAAIESELEVIQKQLARLPTRQS
jgi:hypothetical protein